MNVGWFRSTSINVSYYKNATQEGENGDESIEFNNGLRSGLIRFNYYFDTALA